jgi:hypothetical protein
LPVSTATPSSSRTEIKFALSGADPGKLESILRLNCKPVTFRGPTSRVTSLYFDDAGLAGCRDNLDGSPRRSKLRLRWYDSPFPSEDLFLEINRRRGETTSKERLRLSAPWALESLRFSDIVESLSRGLPMEARETWLARPQAIVLVEYERRYYQDVGSPVRLTFDRGLVFYSQIDRLRLERRFAVRAPELLILEAKMPVGREFEDRLRELLHPLDPRMTRSSKYVTACQSIGLLPGSHYR